jgi:IS66 C-terminal element
MAMDADCSCDGHFLAQRLLRYQCRAIVRGQPECPCQKADGLPWDGLRHPFATRPECRARRLRHLLRGHVVQGTCGARGQAHEGHRLELLDDELAAFRQRRSSAATGPSPVLIRAHRTAAIYSRFETCALNDVDPRAWMAYVLEKLPDNPAKKVDELLPWNSKARTRAMLAA